MCGAIPPLRSSSANCSDDRSSNNVSPPYIDAIKTPSGRRQFITDLKHPGKSFTQWRLKLDITKSKEFGSNCKRFIQFPFNRLMISRELYIKLVLLIHLLFCYFQSWRSFCLLKHCRTHVAQVQMFHSFSQDMSRYKSAVATFLGKRIIVRCSVTSSNILSKSYQCQQHF